MPREDMVRSKYHQIVTEVSYFRPDCAQLSSQCVSEKGGRKIIEEGFKEGAKTTVSPMGANQLLVENTCVTSNVRGAKNGGRIDGHVDRGAVVPRDLRRTVALAPVLERAAHDGQKPHTSAAAVERADILQRPHARVLNAILRIVDVARQPPRQVVCGIQMRQDQLLETGVIGQICAPRFPARP